MAGVVDHAGNMKEFTNFYGISVDFPAMYIQYAKFYPLDPRYSIQVIKYVLPEDMKIVTHNHFGEKSKPQSVNEVYNDPVYHNQGIRLIYQDGGSVREIKTIAVPFHQKVLMTFSPDGQHLAIYHKHKQESKLLVYDIEDGDLLNLLEKIEAEQHSHQSEIKQVQDTKKMQFTRGGEYLAIYGHFGGVIFSLKGEMVVEKSFDINNTKFKVIFDLEIMAIDEDQGYRCEIACLLKGLN